MKYLTFVKHICRYKLNGMQKNKLMRIWEYIFMIICVGSVFIRIFSKSFYMETESFRMMIYFVWGFVGLALVIRYRPKWYADITIFSVLAVICCLLDFITG